MAPASWPPSALGKSGDDSADTLQARMTEARQPQWRRWALVALIIGQTWVATHFMRQVLPYHGGQGLELIVLLLFAVLFLWLSAGFWTAIMGFVQLLRGNKHHLVSRHSAGETPIPQQPAPQS